MAEQDTGSSSSAARRRRTGKQPIGSSGSAPPESDWTSQPPCGACKFLRKKCVIECIFAPHFSSDQGAALFAGVHLVFGARNVSKILMQLPPQCRHQAVETISYEAQARLRDPVYGCVGTIITLQQQVAALQAEIAMMQNQLMNNRLIMANQLQGAVQPAYSHPSSAENNNVINMSGFDSGLQNIAGGHQVAGPSQPNFDHLQFSQAWQGNENDKGEGDGGSLVFNDPMLHSGWVP